MSIESTAQPTVAPTAPPLTPAPEGVKANGDRPATLTTFDDPDGPSFSDLLDIINPLQHIPIINTIYRRLTGDDLGGFAQMVGGTLWGGPIGFAASLADLAVRDQTGQHIGDNVITWFDGDDAATTKLAKAETPATQGALAQADQAPPQPEAAPVPAVASEALPAQADAPMLAGDYMIFSAAALSAKASTAPATQAANAPVSLKPAAQAASGAQAALPSSASTASASAPARALSSAAQSSGPAQIGDYLVFSSANAGALAASAAASSARSAGQTVAQNGSDTRGRGGAMPSRSNVTARQTLPPPTTGRAAVPGGQAMAVSQVQAGAGSDAASAANNQWFVNAFTQAMNKYERSGRSAADKADADSTGAIPAPAF